MTDNLTEHRISANGTELNVLELGPSDAPCVIMVHGLRDSAWSLLPVAQLLVSPGGPDSSQPDGYRVLLPELRGHGRSARSDAYAMPNFLLDLHAVVEHFTAKPSTECAVFGHSLGGHIVTKYAALFPEVVKTVLVVEGLGPPTRPHEGKPAEEIRAYREMLLARLSTRPSQGKPLTGLEDAAARLQRNNPRLQPDETQRITPHLLEEVDGQLRWAFDSRANGVFLGVSTADNLRFWQQVQAPTCLVSGALSYEYWGSQMNTPGFSGHFAAGEMETRAQNFQIQQHHWFENSGHMVHYDEPERLGHLCRQYLEQHYV